MKSVQTFRSVLLKAALPRWFAVLVTAMLAAVGAVAATAPASASTASAPAGSAAHSTAHSATHSAAKYSAVRPATDRAPSSIQFYVGYADNLRANPVKFPTPWAGSPGVIFQGCTPNCTFDAGAFRIVNNSSMPQTIDSVIVKQSSCVWDIWPHGTVLQPTQQLIDTQTSTVAAGVCGGTSGAFDTSDVGVGGVGTTCTPDGVVDEVDVTIGGVTTVLNDTGQVLNTGGIDVAACPSGTNESEQWSVIPGPSCPSATLTLAPVTQAQTVGSPVTLNATLVNSCGQPLQGVEVDFTIPSGPNAGLTGSGVTDANGVATFTYTGALPGTDTVQAGATNPSGTITSNPVTVIWQKRTTQLTITGGAASSDFNDPATVAATLTDNLGPVAGQTVVFTLNGAETCSGTTDANGVASCSITPQEAAGLYTLTAAFAGSATDLPSSTSSPFTVTHEETTLTYTGPTKTGNGQSLTLSGVLLEDGTTPIAGRTVTFTLGSGASAQSCTGTTDASGSASCTIAVVNQPSNITTVGVTAVFAGDAYYLPSSASATLKFLFLTGRAFGLSASGLVNIAPTPDTGAVQTTTAGTVAPPCTVSINGPISAGIPCAQVTTALNPATSNATASVQRTSINVLGLPAISVGAVRSSSTTSCSGSFGTSSVASISVAGIPLNINVNPAPNTTLTVLGLITIVLNEQIPVTGPDQGLTVNAVHIEAPGLNVVLASSSSDIGNC